VRGELKPLPKVSVAAVVAAAASPAPVSGNASKTHYNSGLRPGDGIAVPTWTKRAKNPKHRSLRRRASREVEDYGIARIKPGRDPDSVIAFAAMITRRAKSYRCK